MRSIYRETCENVKARFPNQLKVNSKIEGTLGQVGPEESIINNRQQQLERARERARQRQRERETRFAAETYPVCINCFTRAWPTSAALFQFFIFVACSFSFFSPSPPACTPPLCAASFALRGCWNERLLSWVTLLTCCAFPARWFECQIRILSNSFRISAGTPLIPSLLTP